MKPGTFSDQLRLIADGIEKGEIKDGKYFIKRFIKKVDREDSSMLYHHPTGDVAFVMVLGPHAEEILKKIKEVCEQ